MGDRTMLPVGHHVNGCRARVDDAEDNFRIGKSLRKVGEQGTVVEAREPVDRTTMLTYVARGSWIGQSRHT